MSYGYGLGVRPIYFPQPPMKGTMSSLARWFQLNAHQPLAVLLAQARSNGHTRDAIDAAIREYLNSGEA